MVVETKESWILWHRYWNIFTRKGKVNKAKEWKNLEERKAALYGLMDKKIIVYSDSTFVLEFMC
jgi:hypothetical protein